jgi:tRNA pseudouridine55 synthase
MEDFAEGAVLLVDKPENWTSFDVVNKLRILLKRKFGKIKVGHAGTLDPLATGLLIICTGKKTKEIDTYMGLDKEYTGSFCMGATTPSFDRETAEDQWFDHLPEVAQLRLKAEEFLGPQEQIPPMFSAVKVNGKAAYLAARKGAEIELKSRPIHIHEFEIYECDGRIVHFRIKCSKGTYIRSIARDFGRALGSGAYLHSLRRTSIGPHKIDNALALEQIILDWEK